MTKRDELIVIRRDELQHDIESSFKLAAGALAEKIAGEVKRATEHLYVFKDWLTTAEAAAYLGISESTLKDEWRAKYNIPCKKMGKQLYFRPEDLSAVIAAQAE